MSYPSNSRGGGYGGRSRSGSRARLRKISKNDPNYKMGYRYQDSATGEEFTVRPFGFTGKSHNPHAEFPPDDVQRLINLQNPDEADKKRRIIFKGGGYIWDSKAQKWRYDFARVSSFDE